MSATNETMWDYMAYGNFDYRIIEMKDGVAKVLTGHDVEGFIGEPGANETHTMHLWQRFPVKPDRIQAYKGQLAIVFSDTWYWIVQAGTSTGYGESPAGADEDFAKELMYPEFRPNK